MEKQDAVGDERLRLPNPFTLPSFSLEKWSYMSLFDPECWYEDLKDFTFATAFMPVSKAQATALVHHYQQHQLSRTDALTPDDEAQLAQLEAELAHAMEEMKSSSARRELQGEEEEMSFFVRLSSRSPKDAGLNEGHPRIMEYLTEELDRFGGLAAADPNQKTVAMQRAAGRILRVTDAKQALWLIVNSERTFTDMVHALGHEDGEWTMKIVLRHWMDGVDLANEFRGFVCQGNLTALSQYNDGNYYPELMGKEELIVGKISAYWQKVKHQVKYQACIVDFVLVNNMQDVYIVEINPFGPVTGGALFDWGTERPLLQGECDVWGDLDEYQRKQKSLYGLGDADDGEDGEREVNEAPVRVQLRYQEYHHDDHDGEPRPPVLRLVHRVPSYLTDDYLMAFPILDLIGKWQQPGTSSAGASAMKRDQNKNTTKTCSLQ